jgi:hypothetical protein
MNFDLFMAGVVLAVHLLFILWVILGWLLTRRRPLWRWLHIACVIYGIFIEVSNLSCPLTLAEAYRRSLDYEVENKLPLETYLEVIEMKKILENRQNWPYFKATFNIPEPGEKGLAKNLRWMDKINELRRIPAHPAEERRYKIEDFQYIDRIYDELMRRLEEARLNPVLETDSVAEGDTA